ncbi:MAG: threonine synthase [Fibrobacteria bacterium]|nr:threonine synthase [Fibrobacteria bacterium]
MEFSAVYKGYESGNEYPLDEIIYRDTDDNLLEVAHNVEALRQKTAQEWKNLFEKRASILTSPFNSGIWGKKEWVLPHIPDSDIISLSEGWTSLLKPEKFNKALGLKNAWVKLCGNSHTGSFKDLGMTVLVSHVNHLIKKGVPIKAVACASTGDTSAALAAYCAYADIPSIVFLPEGKISTAQLIQPISNGSLVLMLATDFDGCMKIVQEVTKDKSIYLANSMNPMRIEGQKTISIEICQQFGWDVPDVIVIPGGNLGNVSALGSGFDLLLQTGVITKKPRIVVAQAAAANPLYLSFKDDYKTFKPVTASDTQASAIQIGNPVSYQRAVRALKNYNGKVIQVSEEELANAAHLADHSGLYCCPHTGVALGALIQMVETKEVDPDERIVVISTAHGLKFSEFKVNYHENKIPDFEAKYANPITRLPADVDKVKEALAKRFT